MKLRCKVISFVLMLALLVGMLPSALLEVSADDAVKVTVGTPVTDSLEENEIRTYEVTIEKSGYYRIKSDSGNEADLYGELYLYGEEESLSSADGNGLGVMDFEIVYYLHEGNTYQVKVREYNLGAVSSYTFSVLEEEVKTISEDTKIVTSEAGTSAPLYSFTAPESAVYRVVAYPNFVNESDEGKTCITVRSPWTAWSAFSFNVPEYFNAESGTEYIISLAGEWTAGYTIYIEEADSAEELTVGTLQEITLDKGNIGSYCFTAEKTANYKITITGEDVHYYIENMDTMQSKGEGTGSLDVVVGGGEVCYIDLWNLLDGADCSILIEMTPNAEIEIGQMIDVSVGGESRAVYEFEVEEAGLYAIQSHIPETDEVSDLKATLYFDGEEIAVNDDDENEHTTGSSRNFYIENYLEIGTYQLALYAYDDSECQISVDSVDSLVLEIGQMIDVSMGGGSIVVYEFEVEEAGLYEIQSYIPETDEVSDLSATLYFAGEEIAANDDDANEHTTGSRCNFYIEKYLEIGTYQLALYAYSASECQISVSQIAIQTTYMQISEDNEDLRIITEFSQDIYDSVSELTNMGVKISKNGGTVVDFATEYVTASENLEITDETFVGAFASIITGFDREATYEVTPYYTLDGGETVYGVTVILDAEDFSDVSEEE